MEDETYEIGLYETEMGTRPQTTKKPELPPRGAIEVTVQEARPPEEKKQATSPWIVATTFLTAIALVLLVVVIIQTSISGENTENISQSPGGQHGQSTTSPTTYTTAKSCRELKEQGQTTDGLYDIQPLDNSARIQAFCDMTTNGGGWTLVASVHETDIKRKCDTDDLWASYLPTDEINFAGKTNWENNMVFGDVIKCTESDYKNSGFFSLNASDVMVWHIPYGVLNNDMKTRSTLRYRTTNGFLRSRGGNLGGIYKGNYSLAVNTDYAVLGATGVVLNSLAARAETIRSLIPNFYSYSFSTSYKNGIVNSYMYRSSHRGNYVYFQSTGCTRTNINYESDYRCASTVFGSRKSVPFFAAMVVFNEFREKEFFSIRVNQFVRHTSFSVSKMQNTTMKGNFKIDYHLVQHYYSSYVTIAEFYFVVSSTEDWKSVEPTTFYSTYAYSSSYTRSNEYTINGSPVNVVMGYALLTRTSGRQITTEIANAVAKEILQAVSTSATFRDFRSSSLSVPVVFDKGSKSEIVEATPPTLRSFAEPGFLQFRAYTDTGYTNAFCPGVRVWSTLPQYLCIGGVSNETGDHGTCGDFAGWEGNVTDLVQSNRPSGLAHSHKDIFSTILLFLR